MVTGDWIEIIDLWLGSMDGSMDMPTEVLAFGGARGPDEGAHDVLDGNGCQWMGSVDGGDFLLAFALFAGPV